MKRLGLLVPSSNTAMEVDFYRHLPPNVTLHTARMRLEETTVEGEEAMLDEHFPRALRDIATARPDVVVFGCTSAGALRGRDYDSSICTRISREAKASPVSVIASASRALAELSAKRVAVITPYIDDLNRRVKASLEHDGSEVIGIWGMGIDDNFQIAQVQPDEIVEFSISRISAKSADCVFISCTNLRAMEARAELQRKLGIPVLTSNQVAFNAAMDTLLHEA